MRLSYLKSPLRTLIFTAILYLLAPSPPHAQAPYLYASVPVSPSASQVAAFAVNPDGTLTEVTGSPFPVAEEGGPVTTDPTDQYLFVLNPTSNTISVMSIGTNGALTSIGSPVPAPTALPGSGGAAPASPFAMATYKGTPNNYLFVVYRSTTSAIGGFNGAVVAYQIGTAPAPLIPRVQTNLPAPPVITSPLVITLQGNLYAVLSAPGVFSGIGVFTIDANSGALNQVPSQGGIHLAESSLAINPAGTILFDGWGGASGGVESSALVTDGTLPSLPINGVSLSGSSVPPSAMLVDGSGQILFVQQGGQAASYVISQSTGALTATAAIPPFSVKSGEAVANPVEPFIYTLQSSQVNVSLISDFQKGTVIALAPQSVHAGANGLAITHNAATQNPAAHAAALWPPAIPFIETTLNQSSSGQTATLVNIGTEPLNISSINVVGSEGNNFAQQQNCPSQLAPQKFCVITVTFKPLQAGALQAALVVTDDADSNPQTIQLTGTGVSSGSGSGGGSSGGTGGSGGSGGGSGSGGSGGSGGGSGGSGGSGSGSGGSGDPPPQPTVSIAPASLNFVSPAQGTPAPQMTVVLTNSNNAPNALPLVISNLQIAGLNYTDFTIATGCNAPNYPSGQSCNPVIVFTPGASGNRVATLVVTDNAANSPQLIPLSGSIQSDALTIVPASAGGNSQSVTAGQTATYSLSVTPTFTGMVSFSPCAGAPTTATCTVAPSQLPVSANEIATLTVTVTTSTASSSATIPDGPTARPFIPLRITQIYAGILCLALLMLLLRSDQRRSHPSFAVARSNFGVKMPAPITAGAAVSAFLTMTLLTLAGCGGASTVATAPTAVPPTASSQTYTITITPTAITSNNLPIPNLQPIQLTLAVD